MKPFLHKPLSDPRNQIRLLTILPQKGVPIHHRPVVCTLEPAEAKYLDPDQNGEVEPLERVSYEALSYAWGKEDPTEKIVVNRQLLKVTPYLKLALQAIGLEERARTLWIDAICIDQANDSEESLQVSLMHSIYRHASRVLVWLGPLSCSATHAIPGVCLVENSCEDSETNQAVIQWSYDNFKELEPTRVAMQAQCLRTLLAQTWWQRLWILQEIALAGSAACVWVTAERRHVWNWATLHSATVKLLKLLTRPDDITATQNAASVLDRSVAARVAYPRPILTPTSIPTPADDVAYTLGLIADCRLRNTSDARDRIFALLGLLTTAFSRQLVTRSAISYKENTAGVYQRLAKALICMSGSLDVFNFNKHGFNREESIEGLGTWAPNWNGDSPLPTIGQAVRDAAQPEGGATR